MVVIQPVPADQHSPALPLRCRWIVPSGISALRISRQRRIPVRLAVHELPLRSLGRAVAAARDEDSLASGRFHDLARPLVQHARLQQGAEQTVQHAAQGTPARDREDPDQLVCQRPASVCLRFLRGHEHPPHRAQAPCLRPAAERHHHRARHGNHERPQHSSSQPRSRDPAVRPPRNPDPGPRDQARLIAGQNAQLAGKRIRGHGGVVGYDPRQDEALR